MFLTVCTVSAPDPPPPFARSQTLRSTATKRLYDVMIPLLCLRCMLCPACCPVGGQGPQGRGPQPGPDPRRTRHCNRRDRRSRSKGHRRRERGVRSYVGHACVCVQPRSCVWGAHHRTEGRMLGCGAYTCVWREPCRFCAEAATYFLIARTLPVARVEVL